MVKVMLSKSEQAVARLVAKERYDTNRRLGIPNKKVDKKQPEGNTDLNGMGGELAVAKALNLYPDLSTEPRKLGADLVTEKGVRIDVKVTTRHGGKLLSSPYKKADPPDVFVLAEGTFPEYTIIGWCFGHELFEEENLKDYGLGVCYGLTQDKLRPLDYKSKILRSSNR